MSSADPLQVAAFAVVVLVLLVCFAAVYEAVTTGLTGRLGHRRADSQKGCKVVARGWRGWTWNERTWDDVWPQSPGEVFLAHRLPANTGKMMHRLPANTGIPPEVDRLVNDAFKARLIDIEAEEDFRVLFGSAAIPPWRRFSQ